MSQPWPILVINLDRSIDRLASISAALNKRGLNFVRVRATEAEERSATLPRRSHLAGEFYADLTPNERACRASHLQALQAVAGSPARAVLVLEDDADFSDDAFKVLDELAGLPGPLPDCISLFGVRARGATLARLRSGHALISSVSPPIGSVAVLWTPTGARKFLAAADRRKHRPIDVQRKHWWEGDLNATWISPAPIREHAQLGAQSTIGSRNTSGPRNALAKWSYRVRFMASSHWRFLCRRGATRWWKAQERVG